MKKLKKPIAIIMAVLFVFITNFNGLVVFADNEEVQNRNSGAIWTTDKEGIEIVNDNHYDYKQDVYLNGGPRNGGNGLPIGAKYYVRIVSPQHNTVLGDSDPLQVEVINVGGKGVIPRLQLWGILKTKSSDFEDVGYDSSKNKEYKVELYTIENDKEAKYKSDNFQVREDYGSLIIKKIIDNDRHDFQTEFSGTISGPYNYSMNFNVKQGESGNELFSKLPYGTYTITETAKDGYTTVGINPIIVQIGDKNDKNERGIGDKDATVTIINHKNIGRLTIYKVIVNDRTDSNTEFKGTLSGPNGYSQPFIVEQGRNGEKVFDNLAYGTYTVTETAKAGYTNLSIVPASVTIDANSESVEITITNQKNDGSLIISKVIGNDGTDITTEFEGTLSGSNGFSQPFKVKQGDNSKIKFDNLAYGTYTVVETPKEGYTTVGINPATVVVGAETKSMLVTITNQKHDGKLTINKIINNDQRDLATEFEGTLSGPNGYSQPFKVKQGEDGKKTFDNLAYGTYTVLETPKEGYTTIGINPATVVVGAETKSMSVTITNQKNDGVLTIYKVIDNDETDIKTEFEGTLSGPNGYNQPFKVKQGDAGKKVFSNLAYGTYKVIETPKDDYTTVEINPTTVKIGVDLNLEVETKSVTVTIINHHNTGTLTIYKVIDNVEIDTINTFKGTLSGPNDFSQPFEVMQGNNGKVIFKNLAPGKYTVTENEKVGFSKVSIEPATVEIGAESENVSVIITNHKLPTPTPTIPPPRNTPTETPPPRNTPTEPPPPPSTPTPTITPPPSTPTPTIPPPPNTPTPTIPPPTNTPTPIPTVALPTDAPVAGPPDTPTPMPTEEPTPVPTETPVPTDEPTPVVVIPTETPPLGPVELPKTGGVPAPIFYGFGLGLIALGVIIKLFNK